MEDKLLQMEQEKARQTVINDELLNQLVKCEEQKQIFEQIYSCAKDFTQQQLDKKKEKEKQREAAVAALNLVP